MNTIMIGTLAAILFVPIAAYASVSPTNTTNSINQTAPMMEISDFETQIEEMRLFNNGCTALQTNPGVTDECIAVITEFNDHMDELRSNHSETISKYAGAGLEVEDIQSGGEIDWENLP